MSRGLSNWHDMAARILEGGALSREEGLAILKSPNDELLLVLDAAFLVRRHHHGRNVNIHVLQNAKSGVCPEDCSFCSQSLKAASGVDQYGMQTVEELVAGARTAAANGAVTYCMVTATRGPSVNELDTVCEATRRIKAELQVSVCASLGLLTPDKARQLAEAGVDRFNHNLETSRRHFSSICTTHTWEDRVATIRAAKDAGMEACCGGIMGMGEALEDRVEMALELAALGVESVPINLLNPRPGTPLSDQPRLSAQDALRALAMVRLCNPASDVRVAGGREEILGSQQPLALYAANSLFAQGYLTTGGQGVDQDRLMIEAAGFSVASISRESV
ncbi:MAG: biotin synthase [Myxococcota bacterium]|jgi:biotin synthase